MNRIALGQLKGASIGDVSVPKIRGGGFSEEIHVAFLSNGFLKCDGSIISGKDYPELYGALASREQWREGENIKLPDMSAFDWGAGVGYIKAKECV